MMNYYNCNMITDEVIINNKRVKIDRPLVEDIIALNEKGYETMFCCAGHVQKDPQSINNFYVVIRLHEDYNINKMILNIPDHLKFEIHKKMDPKKYVRKYEGAFENTFKDEVWFVIRPNDFTATGRSRKKVHEIITERARDAFHKYVKSL